MKDGIFKRKAWRKPTSSTVQSVGLGMPLARALARKLRGDMVECGVPGVGARFLVYLVRKM
jgi:signal transduction histidine kinase